MQTLKSICRIVQGVYSLFQSYICTPHFADACHGLARPLTRTVSSRKSSIPCAVNSLRDAFKLQAF